MYFRFKALDARQQLINGESEALDLDALIQQLQQQGLELLHVRRKRKRRVPRISRRDIIDFCFQIEHLLNAGIPLLDALHDLAEHSASTHLRALCQRLSRAVSNGQALSAALQTEGRQLEPAFIGLIRAGEISGRLPDVLQRMGHNLQQAEALAARTSQALTYPAVAGALVIGASIFLMRFLVPQVRVFLDEAGLALPLHTRLLFALSDFLDRYWGWVAGLPPSLLLIAILAARSSPGIRLQLDRYALKVPLTGALRRKTLIARQADLLALLYATGIPLLEALEALHKSCANRFLAQALKQTRDAVEQGSSLADAFARHEIFPPLLIRMLQVGERSGALEKSLGNIARLYEREASTSMKRLQTLIEPALTLSIGILLGWIMLSILQPIYSIIGQTAR
ncbi:type II secretion system F family protein [Azonexus sp.]|uniref:type II secretion system F family protein n=1 Tax=Azonexus sp. TaxID=1872668 RepID=UPI0027B8F01F|nr:type II secretion system F family protein [Azonexus sp.]